MIIKDFDPPIIHHRIRRQIIYHISLPFSYQFDIGEAIISCQTIRNSALVHVNVDDVLGFWVHGLDVD